MKFTAVYKTEVLHERRFEAEDVYEAKAYCNSHFPEQENILLISHDDPNSPDWHIHLGDARKTSAIERAYNRGRIQ